MSVDEAASKCCACTACTYAYFKILVHVSILLLFFVFYTFFIHFSFLSALLSLSLSLSLSLLSQYTLQCWPLMKLLMVVITSSLSPSYRIQLQFLTTSSLTTAHATSHHLKPQKKTKKVQQTFIHVHTCTCTT